MTGSEKLANTIAKAMDNMKGHKIVKMDLRKIENCFCKFFIICHGNSNTQVASLAENVEEEVRETLKEKPFHVEGTNNSQWVVMDYGDVVAHIFQKEERSYYQIEDFWADAKITEMGDNE